MNTGEKLSAWAVEKIKKEYPGDVALLINHTTLQLKKDVQNIGFSYYVPATNRANGLARTFIIGEIGYDLFPMPWERLERMADMKHYNTTCLADITESQILYAADESHRQRFLALQARLRANLQNPMYMRERAGEWFRVAKETYLEVLLDPTPAASRMNAGYVCDLLAIVVAFVNGTYFKGGQTDQLKVLEKLEKVPEGFASLYRAVVEEPDIPRQAELCRQLILATGRLLEDEERTEAIPADYRELADWYQELCYTWRRVTHWCVENDPVNAYIWSCMLQNEANGMAARFDVGDADMLGYFDAGNLKDYAVRVSEVEQRFVQAIREHGVELNAYRTVEEFLEKNR